MRDSRDLTLKQGENELQFSWENTLIDPTSLSMLAKAHADKIDIADLTFPPRVKNLGVWDLDSRMAGRVPFEITYLTSGLSWRAFYMGTLAEDEKTMRLQGYVRVTNNSGEDYENAQIRLIVGQVHMIDEIAQLARQEYPYGRPGMPELGFSRGGNIENLAFRRSRSRMVMDEIMPMAELKAKEIRKEGLSEYFLYTIEGTETIPNTWSKRLPSFETDQIPVVNLYKFEEEKYGSSVVRYLSFTNDEKHKLGQTPIPGGMLKVYRTVDAQRHLSCEGQSDFKYIPVGEEVELNLGAVRDVIVEPKLTDYRTDNTRFDNRGNISGWDEIKTFRIEVKNTRSLPVRIEIKRNFPHPYWTIRNEPGTEPVCEKVDVDTVKYTLLLEPAGQKTLAYTVTSYEGVRRDDYAKQSRDASAFSEQDQHMTSRQGQGLVGSWSFDEGGGDIARDTAGGVNGTIHGARWTDGIVGRALEFNGRDDYVVCEKPLSLSAGSGLTVCAWIYPRSGRWAGIVDKGDKPAVHDDFGLWFNDGAVELSFNWPERWNIFPNGDRFISPKGMPLNEWSFAAGTWNGEEVTLSINGRTCAVFPWTEGPHLSGALLYFGVNPAGADEFFHGKIDEVRIYNTALSEDEIRQLYEQQQAGQKTL